MIEVHGLTRRYRTTLALDDVSFTAMDGRVTGFLGPNGSGKSTTMRLVLGLESPDAGSSTVDGMDVRRLAAPLHTVGALLDGGAVIPSLSPRAHLRALARTQAIPDRRVDEVLAMVGLTDVARRAVRSFSLGMHQRLGIATAMLGDPHTLLLDEPINGLDPEGVIWMRGLVRHLAAQGRCVLLSSHVMAEVATCADDVVVIGAGHVLRTGPLAELLDGGEPRVRVRAEHHPTLMATAARRGWQTRPVDGGLEVIGVVGADVGRAAVQDGLVLSELTPVTASLEERYLALTDPSTQFRGQPSGPRSAPLEPAPAVQHHAAVRS